MTSELVIFNVMYLRHSLCDQLVVYYIKGKEGNAVHTDNLDSHYNSDSQQIHVRQCTETVLFVTADRGEVGGLPHT
jgi:hypothetical protein